MSTHSKTRRSCAVVNCRTNKLPEGQRGRLFYFPAKMDQRLKWLRNLRREDLQDKTRNEMTNYMVCKLHFSDHQFRTPEKNKLNIAVVPNPVCDDDDIPNTTSVVATESLENNGVLRPCASAMLETPFRNCQRESDSSRQEKSQILYTDTSSEDSPKRKRQCVTPVSFMPESDDKKLHHDTSIYCVSRLPASKRLRMETSSTSTRLNVPLHELGATCNTHSKTRRSCAVVNCPTNKLPEGQRGRLFYFPAKMDQRMKWLRNLRREDLQDKTRNEMTNYMVCKLHFSDHQFRTPEKIKLNIAVVPNPVFDDDDVANTTSAVATKSLQNNSALRPGVSALLETPLMKCQRENDSSRQEKSQILYTDASSEELPKRKRQCVTQASFIHESDDKKRHHETSNNCVSRIPSRKRLRMETSSTSTRLNVPLHALSATWKTQLTLRKKPLYTRLRQIVQTVAVLKKRRNLLQHKILTASRTPTDYINYLQDLPRPLKIFIISQLRNFQNTKIARKFTFQEKCMFLSVHKHSPKCYRHLQKLLALPCPRSLRKVSNSFNLRPGINNCVFRYLNIVSEREKDMDKYCILMFDEMKLSKNLSLVVGKNTCRIQGFVDLGNGESGRQIADHALVFMIRGIRRRWKQPVAFYFTKSCANSITLKRLISDVIRAIHTQTNYKIIASVSAGGSWNVGAIRLLSQVNDKVPTTFEYNVDGNKIFHLFDTPHLMKCIRNGFIGKNIVFDGHKTAKWSDIKQVYFQDGALSSVKMSKLTRRHVKPLHREKICVKTAVQIFSSSTRMCLELLSHHGVINGNHTAEFVGFMNNLFDSLNWVYNSATPYGGRVTGTSPHHDFWNRAKNKLKGLSFIDEHKGLVSNPASISLAICTIRNVEELWKFLNKVGFKFLNTRSLNLHPVENFFSAIKGLCGSNTRPTCSQFASAYKACVVNNSVKSSTGTNCEDDGERFLFTYDALLSAEETEIPSNSEIPPSITFREPNTLSTYTCPQPVIPSVVSMLSTLSTSPSIVMSDFKGAHIAGFLLKNFLHYECQSCTQFLESDTRSEIHDVIRPKEYDENSRLTYPSEPFIQAVNKCKDEIFLQIPLLIHLPNFFSRLKQSIHSNIPSHFCFEHGVLFQGHCVNLLCLVIVKHFTKMVNKIA